MDTLVVSPQVISLSFVALSVIVLSNFQACLSRRSILAASFILPLKSPKRTPNPTPPHPTSLSLTPDNYNLLLAQAQTLQAPLVTISVSPQHRGRGSCSGEWWQLTQRSYGMEPLLSATPPSPLLLCFPWLLPQHTSSGLVRGWGQAQSCLSNSFRHLFKSHLLMEAFSDPPSKISQHSLQS